MADALRLDLTARRNALLAYEWTFTDDAGDPADFTGATVTMQVRQYGAQAGTALINLVEVAETTPATEGLQAVDGVVSVYIDEASLYHLPRGADGASIDFYYDLKVELSGVVAEVWAEGLITVKPGVTERTTYLVNASAEYLVNGAGAYLTTG